MSIREIQVPKSQDPVWVVDYGNGQGQAGSLSYECHTNSAHWHHNRKVAMKKIVITALLAATSVAALSACSADSSANAGGTTTQAPTSKSKAPATKKAVATTKAVATPKAPAKPKYTVAEQNAIKSALSYLSYSGFSRVGLIDQLSSKAGEGFKMSDAVFAVNHIKVDWNKEAVESAKSYLNSGAFSRAGLIDQLSSKAGEGFTLAQATYAANHVGL